MNIYIVNASRVGSVNERLVKAELILAAKESNITLVDKADLADVTILIGKGNSSDNSIIGKKVYRIADLDAFFAEPKKVLLDAKTQAVTYRQASDIASNISNNTAKRIIL